MPPADAISEPNAAERETARTEAFSDGVFSIAITLLVLELKIPHRSEETSAHELLEAILKQWPAYIALVTSFVTILIMWVNHHGVFCHLRRIDAPLILINGFLLLLVTLVPFPTALVSDYFATPAGPVACAVYSALFFVIGIAYNLLWWIAQRGGRLLAPESSPHERRRITRAYFVGLPGYFGAFVAAVFGSVSLSMGICIALWLFWVATIRRL